MAKNTTEICNLAISWLGGNKIMSVEHDESKEARLCRANYDASRKAVLEERDWTFASKRAVLTPLLEAPLFGYSYAFLVPSDCLVMRRVYNPQYSIASDAPQVRHNIEGGQILCDLSKLNVRYTYDEVDPTRYSPLFDQALAAHIAMCIAMPLTQSKQLLEDMKFLYEDKLQKAISTNSLQGSRELLDRSQLENSRRMFTRPY